ncbi:MAG: hypothetical protein NWF07_08885 [Candidatus Bathyarchaeota archaeon]|nr:hypothetical protein [Candidatus Bathyarchaeota archaeon]
MTEQTLHEQLKDYYAKETGAIESPLGDYRVDVVRGDLLIEIQTRSFSSIRDKLRDLVGNHRIRLVHPIAYQKWIIRLDKTGKQVQRRKSPKKGRVEEIFYELVYMPKLLGNSNFELEVVMVDLDEYWIDDGKGSWRRRRWSIHDKRMLELRERHLFASPEDFKKLLPESLPTEFTSRMVAKETGLNIRVSQKMLYCLSKIVRNFNTM